MNRRGFVVGAAAAAALAPLCAPGQEGVAPDFCSDEEGSGVAEDIESIPSLGALAGQNGIIFGSAFDVSALCNPGYERLLRHHARILTTDNSLKFGMIRGDGPTPDYVQADALVDFASRAKTPLRGHALAWNESLPDWIKAESGATRAYWLQRHIEETCARYAGRIHSWDVVNEPFWPGHGNEGDFRGGAWFDALGKDYIVKSMKWAAAADPHAKLVINEAGAEWLGDEAERKRRGLLRLVAELKDAGVRIDIVGLESHWDRTVRFSSGVFRRFIDQLGALGVDVYITELDAADEWTFDSAARRDRIIASAYRAIVRAALRSKATKAIITWELADNHSYKWTDPRPFLNPFWRPRPLPFDANLNPKPAYHALAAAFRTYR